METVNVPLWVVVKLLNSIAYVAEPYLDDVQTDEDCTDLKINHPYIADLCEAYDRLLMECSEELKKDYEFFGL